MEPLATKLSALLQTQDTTLTPEQERGYQAWKILNRVPDSNDYNMRGFYQSMVLPNAAASGVNPNDGMMHYPDTFKLPNHQSFSTESGYYNPATMAQTPSWSGGQVGDTQAQSWMLRRPNGEVVQYEAPWLKGGVRLNGKSN